jgi:phosphatidylglycerophosphate synthase
LKGVISHAIVTTDAGALRVALTGKGQWPMFDHYLLEPVKAALTPLARRAVARGIGADRISLAGFAIGALAVPALAYGHFGAGLVLIAINRVADGLDGTVARLTVPTDRGAFLDVALDFLFYALIPLGFALADPTTHAPPAAVLITAFVGTGSTFLAFATIAERRGLKTTDYPAKGIYYLGGLTEGSETIAVFTLMCLFPGWFAMLAYGYAALCALTTALRLCMGWQAFAPTRPTT